MAETQNRICTAVRHSNLELIENWRFIMTTWGWTLRMKFLYVAYLNLVNRVFFGFYLINFLSQIIISFSIEYTYCYEQLHDT